MDNDQIGLPSRIPANLFSVEEIVEKLGSQHRIDISAEQVLELTKSGHLPCWRWNGGPPFFQMKEIREWFLRNWLSRQERIDYPTELRVLCTKHRHVDARNLPAVLMPMRQHVYQLSGVLLVGVYFLVLHKEEPVVVYVGQSTDVSARIQAHSGHRWDTALVLPVPHKDLLAVERTFIRYLDPPLNKTKHTVGSEEDQQVLSHYGIESI